ncbi:NmrA-like family-domain-containing protein [Hypoxylon trugodes]|uniref:NmrA-like family-domain-containing protein n=1 Tax=Hypoxylon trugodes TaxID=326681 RepID=UPI0021950AE6|nr:NmrA-like family-domain-containing protein [Hypoxylon trugodes]KAI1385807.1 NmrA-like family-domain-containing protein [Hypoxylon trugodes]
MSAKKIITVFGATGAQGGGVVDTFQSDPKLRDEWVVRAATRDTSKDSAKKLASAGVEVVFADLDDKASLVSAMKGSYAAFGVTNYWERASADVEIQQGRNLADAAKEAGVQHYIWSSLLNIKELSGGELPNVYHFDSKATVAGYIRESEDGFLKQVPPDNNFALAFPVAPNAIVPVFHPADTGKYIKAIVHNRDALPGNRFLGATAYITAAEVLEGFKRVFPEAGKTARYFQMSEQMFRDYLEAKGTPDCIITELYENMKLLETFGYYGGEPLDTTAKLVEDHLTTWEEYARNVAPGFRSCT